MEQITLTHEGLEPLVLQIDPDIRDDVELFEALCDLDDKNYLALARIVKRLLGDEQKSALYDWLRGENGRVRLTDVSAAIAEIFAQLGDSTKK